MLPEKEFRKLSHHGKVQILRNTIAFIDNKDNADALDSYWRDKYKLRLDRIIARHKALVRRDEWKAEVGR